MENMNLQKFNFDFELTYKELKTKALKNRDNHTGIYHYLQITDRFHDVLEKVIKYLEDRDTIEQTDFIKLFWTNWKFSGLENKASRTLKSQASIKTTYVDGFEDSYDGNLYGVNYQPDLDQKELIAKIRTLPTVSKIMEGYNARELAEQAGMSRHTFYQRYHKELKKIMV